MALNPLTALSPLDGRYSRQCDPLRGIFSEYAFMSARVRVEVEWLIALSEAPHTAQQRGSIFAPFGAVWGRVCLFSIF